MYKIKSLTLFIIPVFLTAGISLTLWKAISYRSKLQRLQSSITSDTNIQPSDHIGSKPIYIFESKIIEWKDLAPNLEKIYGNNVEKKIVGTFPVPNDFSGTDIAHITSDNKKIYFPSYGAFYLHTTIGFFKILLINQDITGVEKILSIASFVSGNTVHSLAGARRICPIYGGQAYPDRLLKTFFASDQPLKQHCGYIAKFLAYILSKHGYRTQLIHLQTEDQKRSHIVMQVFMPEINEFAMIDPDYGAIVRNHSQKILSIQEIAILVRQKPDSILIDDIGNKHWLKSKYNNAEPMPDFTWTPDKSGHVKTVMEKHYHQILEDYTAIYWICNKTAEKRKKFYWDGSELKK